MLDVIEDDERLDLRQRTLRNFEVLFRRFDKAQRDALRDNNRERTSKVLNRLRRNFLKDHPKAASRRDTDELLENILNHLLDTSPEAETIRDAVRRIRADFSLADEPLTPVKDDEALTKALESLVYQPVREVQVGMRVTQPKPDCSSNDSPDDSTEPTLSFGRRAAR